LKIRTVNSRQGPIHRNPSKPAQTSPQKGVRLPCAWGRI